MLTYWPEPAFTPSRTLYRCPVPGCPWETEWPHPDRETMMAVVAEHGMYEAPHVLVEAANAHVEDDCERHFMAHMRGEA